MADVPKTSFIPKQAIGGVSKSIPRRRKHFNIFSFIGIVVCLCGMILAVGVFLYKGMNEKALEAKKLELQNIKSSFSHDDIEALRELDRRIAISRALLDKHLSPSVLFDALELRTQKEVQFTGFSYAQRESGSVELTLEGTALRFNTVALQSVELADAEALSRVIFSGLAVEDEGNVQFKVTGEGNNKALAYTAAVVALMSTENPDIATTTTAVPTATTTATTTGALPGGPSDGI